MITPLIARPLVYVAAPYSNPDPVENTNFVIRRVNDLIDAGLVTPVAPHLTLLWHLVTPRPLEFWYEYDLALLARCDALYRLDGESTGADAEAAFAATRGLPVLTSEADLNRWVTEDWHDPNRGT